MSASDILYLKRLNIDTQIEHVVYMPKDCPIHKSEGFRSLNRVLVSVNGNSLIASLNIINDGLLNANEAGLSEGAWAELDAKNGDVITFSHAPSVESMRHVRKKMYQKTLKREDFREIVLDVLAGRYSNIELSAFVTACAGDNLDIEEIIALTQTMVETGDRLIWERDIVMDKHCIGGLPGNRTTPIVVAILAEAGLTIPKTSSRAITSPAGTADTMETITNVTLSNATMREVISKHGGCFCWGKAVNLSPVDDILIRVERALDIDCVGQMIASVLSKKSSAGSTHVLIDIPMGKTAKVRSHEEAEKLKYHFTVVGAALGLKLRVIISDGTQPVGRGIGPALEAFDILGVLRNQTDACRDLKEKSLLQAGELLEFSGKIPVGKGIETARQILESGKAYTRFEAICRAQGDFREPPVAKFRKMVNSEKSGVIKEVDNRKLAKIAKLAGAPTEPSAGLILLATVGANVITGQPLFELHSQNAGEMNYVWDYVRCQHDIFLIE